MKTPDPLPARVAQASGLGRSRQPVARATSSASALLLVLWALVVLSAAVFTWVAMIHGDLEIHSEANRDVEARAMAHSGLAVALHPLVTIKTPLLEEDVAADLGYKVRIMSEGGRLNINWLLRGEDPRKLVILKQWLENRGLEFQDRETLVDCLLDYVDGDNLKRLNGQEDEGDYHPPNRELTSVDEIAEVPNSGPLVSQAGWKDGLTIDSQGPIDLIAASAETMRLLPGLGEARIAAFLTYRQGKDGLDGTIDDPEFKNLKEIQSFLGLSDTQFKELGGLVMLKDPTMHIISEGRAGNAYRQLEVVVRKAGASPQILSWKE
ncbi:MAG: general secretion pathway protein GspK [Verrucomicrobia bacterium]|nr:MAG: general secretion pathway protein GspK [Verrucomicrobiota bacterium]